MRTKAIPGAAALALLWIGQGCGDDTHEPPDATVSDAAEDAPVDAGPGDLGVDVADAGQEMNPAAEDAGVTDPGTPQLPPTGKLNVDAWFATEAYKHWSCEGHVQSDRPLLNHGRNRVCSNNLASGHGSGEYPVGAASVIELYDNADRVVGRGLSRHMKAGADEATWYWYLELDQVTFVDGRGGGCASCHAQAGQAGLSGHDFVYIQVH